MRFLTMGLTFVLGSTLWAGGSVVGNGGGFGLCPDQNYYSYDYLFTYNHSYGSEIKVNSTDESLKVILETLRRYQEPLAEDLNIFINELFSRRGLKYRWLTRSPLPLVQSVIIDQMLPASCKKIQAILFFQPLETIAPSRYYVDLNLLFEVQAQSGGSLQVSYLLIHEWLWNYFPSSQSLELAKFNRLLHSKIFHTLEADSYQKMRPNLKLRSLPYYEPEH